MSIEGVTGRLGRHGMVVDDRYRLEELLGAGGFGEVWRATQEVEGAAVREVALKLLVAPARSGNGSDGARSDDWLNEVRAVRNVSCAAIAPIYDVGVERETDLAFISMLLLSGETLAERLRRGPIPWRRALAIARDIAEALRACHDVEVQHCDLKPQNIFLHADGKVFVLDFGVARLGVTGVGGRAASAALPQGVEYEAGATGTVEVAESELPPSIPPEVAHQIYGTPGYIAPERYSGAAPTPAGDVYALGVVLYQMLCGALPYDLPASMREPTADSTPASRQSYRAQLHAATVRGNVRSPADTAPGTPSAVVDVVQTMLALQPETRGAGEIVARLDAAWRRPFGIPDPPYVGLESFDRRRAGYIAGRDADIDHVVAKLETERAVVLVGPSGCGKSSLAIAGVAARIDERLLDGTDGWDTIVVRPSDRDRGLWLADTAETTAAAGAAGVVVIVDQLEEALGLPAADRARFGAALVALARGTAPVVAAGRSIARGQPARVVATVRDDLFGPVAALPELERVPESNVYTVRGVDPNGLRAIVAGPAGDAGYELEGADEVIADAQRILGDDAGALPMVQFALTQWWDQRDQTTKRLTRAAWGSLGGIEGALAEVAQAVFDGLSASEREHMKALVLALFRADGTRVRVSEAELGGGGAASVLEELIARRLVQRRVDGDGAYTLEVVHEALARRWPLLHGWLDAHRAERELIEDAGYDAGRWESAGRPPEMLWRGARLAAALEVEAKLGDAAGFVAEARRSAGRQRRVKRGVIGAALVVLTGFVIALVVLFFNSERSRRSAEDATQNAVAALQTAEEQTRIAEAAKGLATDAKQVATEATETAAEADKIATEAKDQLIRLAEERVKLREEIAALEATREQANQAKQEALSAAVAAEHGIKKLAEEAETTAKKLEEVRRELDEARKEKAAFDAALEGRTIGLPD